jgi:sporulation integral membrane protein YtvI
MRLGIRLILALAVLWALVKFGRRLLSLFAPFLAAMAAAAILNPAIHYFQKKLGWSRRLLTMLILLVLLGLLGGALARLGYGAGQELLSLAQNWKGLLQTLQTALTQLDALFTRFAALVPPQITQLVERTGDELLDWLNQAVPALLGDWAAQAGQKAMGLPSVLVAVVIFVMATYLLASDYPYLRSRAVQNMDEGVLRFLQQVKVTALGAFGGYLKAELLLSCGVFVILLVGFSFTGQPYGLLLALLLAVMDFIPIVGAGTVMVPWAVMSLFTQDYPSAISLMVIWGIIVVFRRVMEPKFVGDQTGLSPILSLVGIYVGMKTAGVLGMILGPILLLVCLNLAGMGMFRGVRLDLTAAARDIAALLSERPDTEE